MKRDDAQLTAERVAALLEARETPPVVRDLLRLACTTVDTFAAERVKRGGDFDFKFPDGDELTPALVRRLLPAMLRKVGAWVLADWQPKELVSPGEKARAA